MTIVPMTAGHLDQTAAIEAQCFSLPWSRQAFAEELAAPNAVYLVCQEGGLVLGYGGMRHAAGEFYVDNIAVSPAHRRQGVGRAVTKALIARARELGGSLLSLEVRPSNQAAVALYTRLGLKPVGLRKNFYDCPKEDGLIMTIYFAEEGEALSC